MSDHAGLGTRYEVLRTVSEGRRASVLQALDTVHDRLVALKVYPVAAESRDELLAEARLLMSIAPHPGLPVVRGDFFTDDGDRYVMVMNWVDGTDLQQLLDEQGDPGLPLTEVVDDLAQVAAALDHLHGHEPPIIHGDVKPANIVRSPNGRVVLVDFDIAGAHAGIGRFGSAGYVAPEVAAGEKASPAADVFGLAATAVTLLNGQPATTAAPTYAGIDPEDQGQLARTLRSALAVDPSRRPRSAGRLIENLRGASRRDHPTGVVTFLATEVADAAHLWGEDPEEMRVAMGRLRDLRDDVVERRGGRIVATMNEGDNTIVVFREATAAVRAALDLHDGVRQEAFPPGMDVRLQAAVAIGEAALADGVYTGAVVDHVVRLRGAAAPGTTLTSEPSAELLVGLVGHEVSVVPLGTIASTRFPGGRSVFGITRPGQESTAGLQGAPRAEGSSPPPPPPPADSASRWAAAGAALQHSWTLTPLTVAGLALIFLVVLSPELGMGSAVAAVMVVSGLAAAGSFAWQWSHAVKAEQVRIAAERDAREARSRAADLARERAETRQRVEDGFSKIASRDARQGGATLHGLRDELDAVSELVRRTSERPSASFSSLLPDLIDETYRHGMSALSDALQLLEFADGPQRHRLEAELAEIEERLADDTHDDERARARDEQRLPSHRRLLARHDEARQRARDLIFEAERCTAALAEARIELASVRAGDTQLDADAVTQTLQDTIRRVRDVQDELRRLGY